jgi:hypothetical protein
MKMPDDLWKFSRRSTRVLKHGVIITAGFVLPLILLRFISNQPLKLRPNEDETFHQASFENREFRFGGYHQPGGTIFQAKIDCLGTKLRIKGHRNRTALDGTKQYRVEIQ